MAASTLRRVRRAVLVAVGFTVGLLALPSGPVSAHAILVDTSPSDGSGLLTAPNVVVFTFSESILADGLSVDVTHSGDAAAAAATVELDRTDSARVVVHLADIGDGTYQVRISARSEEDLHEVVARTSFAIGEAPPEPSPPVVAGPDPVESSARWLFACGLALLVGVAAVRTRWPDVPIDRPHRLHTLVLTGIMLVLVGRVGLLVARLFSLGGDRLDAARTVMGTTDARLIVLVGVALGCVFAGENTGRAVWLDVPVRLNHQLTCRRALTWLGVIDLALLAAWGGHSALDGSTSPLDLVAKSTHLIGLGLWAGVLLVVLATNKTPNSRRTALSAMSDIAVLGAILTVVSGLVLASDLVVSLTAAAATPYGVFLAFKVILLVVAVGLGVAMRRRSNGGWPMAELGVLGLVVVLGAAMATATPAVDPAFTDDPIAAADLPLANSVDDLLVQARAIPGHPGTNTVELRVAETRRPSLGAVTSVDLVVGTEQYTAVPDDRGLAFVDAVTLPAGDSAVSVVVHRAGWADTTTTLTVITDTAAYVHPPWVSSHRIRWPLLALAAMIALSGVLVRILQARPARSSRDRLETVWVGGRFVRHRRRRRPHGTAGLRCSLPPTSKGKPWQESSSCIRTRRASTASD